MDKLIKKLRDQGSLSDKEITEVFELLLASETTEAQIKDFLKISAELPVDAAWLTGGAQALREHCLKVDLGEIQALDTAGTGGDATGSFNFSTAAALLAAACGVPVAKHGNRSISSKSGSADLLEALGVPIDLGPEEVRASVAKNHFGFMMAPKYHPATAKVQQQRRALGKVTVFNFLGPLANPARVPFQVLGVNRHELRPVMAEALKRLGTKHAWVLWGEGGMDECSLLGSTHVCEVRGGKIREFSFSPEDVTLRRTELKYLKGGDGAHNAKLLEGIFAGSFFGPIVQGVILNAGAALVVGGAAEDIQDGVRQAKLGLNEGKALELLQRLRQHA